MPRSAVADCILLAFVVLTIVSLLTWRSDAQRVESRRFRSEESRPSSRSSLWNAYEARSSRGLELPQSWTEEAEELGQRQRQRRRQQVRGRLRRQQQQQQQQRLRRQQQRLYSDTSVSYERYQPGVYQRPAPPNYSSALRLIREEEEKPSMYYPQSKVDLEELFPGLEEKMPYFDQGEKRWVCPANSVVVSSAREATNSSEVTVASEPVNENVEDLQAEEDEEDEEMEEARRRSHVERSAPAQWQFQAPFSSSYPYSHSASASFPSVPLSLSDARALDARLSQGHDLREVLVDLTGIEGLVDPHKGKRVHQAASFFGSRSQSTVPSAQPAFCQPGMTIISLPDEALSSPSPSPSSPTASTPTTTTATSTTSSSSSSFSSSSSSPSPHYQTAAVFYYPSCIRIERCGGCCSHDLLQCQPTEVEMVSLKVVKTEFYGSRLTFAGEETTVVERHRRCVCDCRIKEGDCHAGQVYLPHECRCMCRNSNSEHICNTRPDLRYWDPDQCRCRCKNPMECSTGMFFHPRECRCKKKASRGLSSATSTPRPREQL